jgi:hypothetical protein
MMNWRYSDRKEPLDLEDRVITSDDPEVVNDALSKLDVNGWTIEGVPRPVSWIRLRTKMSIVKERFLESSLAGRRTGDIASEMQ